MAGGAEEGQRSLVSFSIRFAMSASRQQEQFSSRAQEQLELLELEPSEVCGTSFGATVRPGIAQHYAHGVLAGLLLIVISCSASTVTDAQRASP